MSRADCILNFSHGDIFAAGFIIFIFFNYSALERYYY